MTINEDRRVEYSAAISMSLHGLIFALYLFFHLTKAVNTQLVLTQVDFLDLKPAPEAVPPEAAPAMQAPRGVKDFLRMALPKFHRSEAQQAPQDIALPNDHLQMPASANMPKRISLDKSDLSRGPSIRLNDANLPRTGGGAAMGDIAVKTSGPRASTLETVSEPKSISLDAVGRRAVATGGGGSINIDTKPINRGGGIRDVGGPSALPVMRGSATGGEGQIQLNDVGGPAVGRARMPAGNLPIGYGRGTGSISLAEKPVGRPASTVLPEPAVKKKAESKMASEVNNKHKALEISGPLAGRKILSVVLPKYPDWARAQGIEADVVIRFFVSPDGKVLDRMILERTSGYPDLDQASMDALKKIVFAPLDQGQEEDQWGVITFRFRLK